VPEQEARYALQMLTVSPARITENLTAFRNKTRTSMMAYLFPQARGERVNTVTKYTSICSQLKKKLPK